ncbi:outer membrane lipoprotein-sorting protein [Marinilongibacter aquaticus]|uniref:outer membrane lipoprotein-sorting protein n=1 Tax=Marinilongibacter aquaticus TaxID=2975157 RepID=UPI0021BD69B9|nr:outer membrane lipoprotein-sorting protein [Marinilongibacter aquaticus]UBM57414.1 outer membrane lipoprotein-sorting protein [Marinilongibacter aquaticus]
MRIPSKYLFFFVCLTTFSGSVRAQQFYRFRADVSVKDKLADGKYRLTMGKVYYDKIYKKIVYDLKFPEKEQVVIQDTSMFTIGNGKLLDRKQTLLMPEFTVFHLALTGKLSDYGLTADEGGRSIYKIGSVEKTDRGIVTTWVPTDDKLRTLFGDIKMLKKDRRLDAMIFYDKNGKMVSRQFFKNYVNVKGVDFPTEVTMVSFGEKGEKNLQQTTYKNIVIDQSDEDEMYRFRIPITGGLSKTNP